METNLNLNVVEFINSAVTAYANVYQSLQSAAELAADQLPSDVPVTEATGKVLDIYAECFGDNHNLKAVFRDLLTLHYAGDIAISVGKGEDETHTTAQVAASLPKHAMREAAKEVRSHYGVNRQSGGGRKKAAFSSSEVATLSDLLKRILSAEDGLTSLKEIMNPLGFNVVRKSS